MKLTKSSSTCQDVSNACVLERQAVFPARFAPIDYEEWRTRTRLVARRDDPKALWEHLVG